MSERIWQFIVHRTGSTRLVAIMRILIGITCWAEFGQAMRPKVDSPTLHLLLIVPFWLSTFCLTIGLFSQISAFVAGSVLFILYYALGMFGPWPHQVHHHTYLLTMGTLLLCLAPCGRSLSVDRRWALHRGTALPERADLWAVNLIAVQLCCVYFFSGIDKSRAAFLSGAELERALIKQHFSSDPMALPLYREVLSLAAWITVILEFVLAFGLWAAPTRRYLLPLAIGFHFMLFIALPVSTFSFTMCVLLMAFVDADAFNESLERLMAPTPAPSGPSA